MEKTFWEAVEGRRSLYGFTAEQPVSRQRIERIARGALWNLPSSMNSQSTRLAVLFGEHHARLWRMVLDAIREVTDDRQFEKSSRKVNGSFASGYGTILFFEDGAVIRRLSEKHPLYAENFAVWSQHTNAMHQFVVWAALEAEGLGASLQHYAELIQADVLKAWSLPEDWKLIAQMPFGAPANPPKEKEHAPIEARIRVFG
jgi:predicted oxidoreductase (fatty acid repression mutant protein)